jgi:hypothetical protein
LVRRGPSREKLGSRFCNDSTNILAQDDHKAKDVLERCWVVYMSIRAGIVWDFSYWTLRERRREASTLILTWLQPGVQVSACCGNRFNGLGLICLAFAISLMLCEKWRAAEIR